jgi:hypothetical protein
MTSKQKPGDTCISSRRLPEEPCLACEITCITRTCFPLVQLYHTWQNGMLGSRPGHRNVVSQRKSQSNEYVKMLRVAKDALASASIAC